MIADARGRPLAFRLLPGQASELEAARALLEHAVALGGGPGALGGPVERVVCDRGYSSEVWRDQIRSMGAEPVVPAHPRHKRATQHYCRAAYRRRHKVEQLWARMKEWRAVATRYDKTASSYLGTLHLAAALTWLSYTP